MRRLAAAIIAWRPDAPLAAIALVGFAVRVSWITTTRFTPTLSDDAGRYELLGRSLAHGGGFINPNGTTTMFWPPGYPFLLAAVYKLYPHWLLADHSLRVALLLNALLGTATIILAYVIGVHAFERRAALVAAAFVALFPSLVFFAGVTLSETAFTFFLMLAIWLIIETEHRDVRLMIGVGIVIGCASLLRGQALLLPLVAAPFWWQSARRETASNELQAGLDASRTFVTSSSAWRHMVVRVVVTGGLALAVVAPWTVRNYVESNSLVLISSNSGVDFYIGHSAGADGQGRIVDELVFRYPDLPPAEAEARVSRDGFQEGLKYAARHPLREVELSVQKAYWLYESDDEAVSWIDGHGERQLLPGATRNALLWLSNVYYYALIAAAVAGARRWWSVRDPVRLLLLSLVVYWTLVHMAFFGNPRFHAPIMPVFAVWAAAAVAAAWDRVSSPN